jgi:hypothetical protein
MPARKLHILVWLVLFGLLFFWAWGGPLAAEPILLDTEGVSVGATGYQFTHMLVADLDHDGDNDLVTANALGQLIAWENNGRPFEQGWPSNLMGRYYRAAALAIADLDGDGDLDVIAGHRWYSDLVVWENNGSPFAGPWTRRLIGHDLAYIGAIAAADMNGDGHVDIVTGGGPAADVNAPSANNRVTLWLNAPLTAVWPSVDIGEATYSVRDLALGDLDGDGNPDIVIGTNRAPAMGSSADPVPREQWPDVYQIRAFRNDGAGEWTAVNIGRDPEFETLSVLYHGFWGAHISSVSLADLDGDGDLDVVASDHMEGDFQVLAFENNGSPFSGELWRGTAISYPTSRFHNWMAANIMDLVVGDFDLDGDPDIASVSNQTESHQLIVWENLGNFAWEDWSSMSFDPARVGHYSTGWLRHDVAVLGANMLAIAASDLDNDGDLDLVSAASLATEPNALKVWRNDMIQQGITPTPSPSATTTVSATPSITPTPTQTPTLTSTPGGNAPPTTGLFIPDGGSGPVGQSQLFTTTYQDANSWQDLRTVNFMLNVGLQGNGLSVVYYRDSNRLYLSNDAGNGWVGWCAPGAARVLSNSYVHLDCGATAVTGQFDTLTVQWTITPIAPFSGSLGTYQAYLRAMDMSGVRSDWVASGTWNLTE